MFNAKVAIDDVELTDCDLHLPSSECSQVRCGNGVRKYLQYDNLQSFIDTCIVTCYLWNKH